MGRNWTKAYGNPPRRFYRVRHRDSVLVVPKGSRIKTVFTEYNYSRASGVVRTYVVVVVLPGPGESKGGVESKRVRIYGSAPYGCEFIEVPIQQERPCPE